MKDLVLKNIHDLRLRLLDLSKRNRLLNFNFADRARNHVRIVDEIPDVLMGKLLDGTTLYFNPLPEQVNEEADEDLFDEYRLRLEAARLTDEEYLKALESIDQEETDASVTRNLERHLESRVRAEMGLPPRLDKESMTPAQYAEATGFNPSYDLPKCHQSGSKDEHSDNRMQTLLFPDQLERKLSGVYDGAKTALSEMGFNITYATFGYLEWFESANSDRRMFAPLLLHPVEISKNLYKGSYEYAVTSLGEETETNITLRELLKRDFGLALPELEEDETVECYFERVEELIHSQSRWKVRRFVVLGLFSFGQLPIYRDLDPANWPNDFSLDKHPIIKALLTGGSGETGHAEEYHVDHPEIEKQVPLLIMDADSSQISAICDALKGKSMAIQGPPGTGKSQTITNLIAAAISEGKSVLFVAEKMAALEVVKNRLDSANLGHFCLELHSTKARKKDVIDSLRHRLEFRPYFGKHHVDFIKSNYTMIRDRLSDFVQTLNSPYGSFGKTLNDMIWFYINICDEVTAEGFPKEIDDIRVEAPKEISREQFDKWVRIMRDLEEATQTIVHCYGTFDKLPWRFVQNSALTPFDRKKISQTVSDWREAVSRIQIAARSLAQKIHPSIADSPLRLQQLCEISLSLADKPIPELTSFMRLLSDPENVVIARLMLGDADEIRRQLRPLQEFFVAPIAIERIGPLIGSLEKSLLGLEATMLSAETTLSKARSIAESLDKASRAILRLDEDLQAETAKIGSSDSLTIDEAEAICEVIRLLNRTPESVLRLRNVHLLDQKSIADLAVYQGSIAALKDKHSEQSARFVFDTDDDTQSFIGMAKALRATSFPATWFNAEYKAAKRHWRSIRREKSRLSSHAIALELEQLASHIGKLKELRSDSRLRELLGGAEFRPDIDFEQYIAVCDFGSAVRKLVKVSKFRTWIGESLFKKDSDDLMLFAKNVGDTLLTRLERFNTQMAEAKWTRKPHYTMKQIAQNYGERAQILFEICAKADELGLKAETQLGQIGQVLAAGEALRDIYSLFISRKSYERFLAEIPGGLLAKYDAASECVAVADQLHNVFLSEEIVSALVFLFTSRKLGDIKADLNKLLTEAASENATRQYIMDLCRPNSNEEEILNALGSPSLDEYAAWIGDMADDPASLDEWVRILKLVNTASNSGLQFVTEFFRRHDIPFRKASAVVKYVVLRSILMAAFEEFPDYLSLTGLQLNSYRTRFQEVDKELTRALRDDLVERLTRRPIAQGKNPQKKSEWTDLYLINNEINKKMRHIPLRALLGRASTALLDMKPCWMMSPLSVAHYLDPQDIEFDLVIIDEASQMRPEEAIGAAARGKQIIVVGDSMQLPPTQFFQKIETERNEADWEDYVASESILDLALGVFSPSRTLRWHYRSRHESLIAFSNRQFYDNKLVVFPSPSPQHPEMGLEYRFVESVYTPKASVNVAEASAVAQFALEFMREHPDLSLGIVTMNQAQRELLLDHMDNLMLNHSEAAYYRNKWEGTLESFFVKNLENVQGDERDAIVISTVYGPEIIGGKVAQRFGPVNSETGHRRLNVLFTRAKQKVVVFSSMKPEDILTSLESKRGVSVLKEYLEYARDGVLIKGVPSQKEPDSDFEVFVAQRLRQHGFSVVPQVGVAGYFVDIGICHPDNPDRFLLGVECDGATYHSAKSARDRDRLREEVLRSLGWELYRIWSTDWFSDPDVEIKKLLRHVESMLEGQRNTEIA